MRTNTGLWPALERLSSGKALLIDWRRLLAKEFDAAKPFLMPTTEKSSNYPCMDPLPCGCRHRIFDALASLDPRWPNAACQCEDDNCSPFFVAEKDRIIWKFSFGTLALAIRQQLAAANLLSGVDADSILELNRGQHLPSHWLAAGRRPFEVSVIFASPLNTDELLRIAETLVSPFADRFLLLTPTRTHYSEAFEVALKRRGCLALPLNELFRLRTAGSLEIIGGNHLSAAFEHLRQSARLGESTDARAAASAVEKRIIGRFEYLPQFTEVWVDRNYFDLRNHPKPRLLFEYLVDAKAFDAASAKHFVDEIDPFVRAKGDYVKASAIQLKDYFNDPELRKLKNLLLRPAGKNGKYFLATSGD